MDEKPSARRGPDVCSLRYGLAVVMHLSNLSMITQRVSLSIAIIAMVNGTQQPAPANASADRPLQDPSGPIGEFHAGSSVYAWSPETQGILFSSISYGILLTLIPSGYLAGIFGAKHMLGAGLLASSLLSLCTPLAADLGVSLVMVIRVAQGMAQGMAWTGQFTIWAKWAPPLERSKLTSIAGSGAALGSSLILCVGGLISQALGWPFIFYIFGGLGCVCCLLWFTVIYDDPMGHPCISLREQEHIVSSLAQQPTSPRRSVPLKAMARCLPLWAIFSGFFSHFWLCTVIVTYLPTYVSSVLHVSIREVRQLPHGHLPGIRAPRGHHLLHGHRLPHQPGLRVRVEARLLPGCRRQPVRPGVLPHVRAGGAPGLGQREDPHAPLRAPAQTSMWDAGRPLLSVFLLVFTLHVLLFAAGSAGHTSE
uniref:Solute carrier family 17 member 2 n=1 Tax=Myotis myotis TaxID=51298 RepID=A0A7J7STJ5_MYOMY|nr:solute carrier family 17 member 2 [Myotis myotis]